MSRKLRVWSFCAVFSALAGVCGAQVTAWNSAVSGNWTTSADWSNGVPSGASFHVVINAAGSGYTITDNTSETIQDLALGSGTANATLLISSANLTLNAALGTSTIASGSTLQLSGAQVLATGTSGAYDIQNSGTILSSGTNYIYGSNLGMNFTNSGTVNVTSGTLTLGDFASDSVTNGSGASILVTGGTLNLGTASSSWTNAGTITATAGGIVNFGGSFTPAALGGTISESGTNSALNITGALSTGMLDLNAPSTGVYTLVSGGSITGVSTEGVINGGALQFGNGGTLNVVTLDGDFSEPSGGSVTVTGDTMFENGTTTFASDTVHVGAGNPGLEILSSATWTGNVSIYGALAGASVLNSGLIHETSGSTNYIYGGGLSGFVFNNHGTVTSAVGTLVLGSGSTDTVNNSGTISAVGGSINFSGGGSHSFVNTGTISATGGGIVNFGGNFTTGDLGALVSESGTNSALNFTGALSLGILDLNPLSAGVYTLVSGGSITGGSTGIVNTGALQFGNGGTLNAVTLNGNFSEPTGGSVTVTGDTLFEGGTTTFASDTVRVGAGSPGLEITSTGIWTGNVSIYAAVGSTSVLNSGTITETSGSTNYFYGNGFANFTINNHGTINSNAGTLNLGNANTDTVNNFGVINAAGGIVTFGGGGADSIVNTGTISATGGGIVNFGGTFKPADLGGTISESGLNSALNITGALNLGMLDLNAPSAGVYTLASGGSVTGGSMGIINTGALQFGGGTLNAVALSGNFSEPTGGSVTVTGDTLFEGGTTTFASNTVHVGVGNPGLEIASTGIWTGNVSIYAAVGSTSVLNSGTITETSGSTNYFYGNGFSNFTINNHGTISATAGTLNLGNANTDTVNNFGAINAAGGIVTFGGGGADSIVNTGTISATGGGIVNFGGTFTPTDLGGTISESGLNSALNITGALTLGTLDLIAPSAGVYTLMSGGSITGGSTGLINNAALQFGNGGTLNAVTLSGNFSEPTGGSVTVTGDTLFEGGTTTFASDTVHVGAGNPGLEIASTGTWTGNVSIYAAVGSTSVLNSGTITETTASTNYFYGNGFSNFTINNHGTISATAGTLNLGNTNTDTVNNFGTISTSGGTITFGGGGVNSFVNTGSISATGGGIINLGGSFTTADMGGTFSESGTNSAINISGTLDNTSATLPTASSGVFTLVSGGTISKGIVDAGTLAFGNGGTLAGVDMVGSFVVPSGTTFTSSAASGTSTLFENGTSSFSSNTVHVGAGSPGLTVASNETWTGNFSIYGNAGPVNVVNNGTLTNTSGGGLYYGNSSTAYTFTNNGTITTTGGSLTIGDASTDMVVNTSLIEATGGTTLSVGTPGTVQNSGTLEATGMNSILNLGSGASTWSNLSGAHITAASGGVVNLGGTFATSNLVSGTISESGTNSAINIVGSLANGSAMLNAPNGGGIFTLASGGTITGGVVNGGALTFGNGGTLANVDMNGSFTVPLSATFTVTGATTTTLFENGTTTFAGNIVRVGAGLPGLAINSDEIWTGSFSIYGNTGTVNVVNNGTLTNTSGGGLYYGNSSTAYTFTNNGTITTTGGSLAIGDASTDMVVNTSLIEATGGTTISVGTPGTVQNSGTLEATGMNSILNLGSGASTWSNLSGAHITAASGGVVNLGGTYSTSNLVSGTIAESGTNSAINIVGSLANGSAMLNAPNGGGIFTLASGGTITGGMVNGTALTFGNGGTLANVDMVGSFTVPLSATFNVTGATNTTLFENGTTTFAGNIVRVGAGAPGLALNSDEVWTGSFSIYGNTGTVNVVNNGTLRNTAGGNLYYGNSSTAFTFTNNGTIDVTGGSLTIGDASTDMIFNTSLIEATGGASISVATAGNVQNSGTLEATGMNTVLNIGSGSSTWANLSGGNITALSGGVVNLGGIFATSNLVSGTISESGTNSAINIVGSLANGSATLNAPNGGGIFTLASGGTITGGTVNGTALTFGNGGTLANVDMVGSFTVPTSATFNVTGATTTTLFQGGTTTFAGNIVRVGAGAPGLALNSDEIWTGSFSIYGNTGTVNIVNNGTLRNTAGGNLYYGNSSAAYTFTNNGTIDVTGGSLTIGDASTDVVSNTGTVDAAGFAVTFGLGSSTLTNFSGTTLAGGVWDASAGGTITFSNATHTIATIASGTTVVLDGAASNIYSGTTTTKLEQSLATNSGTLEVLSSRNFAATNAVTNNGTIQLGGGTFSAPSVTNGTSSTLLGTGTFTATSGGFSIGGTAVVAPGTSVANGYVGSMNFNVGSSSSLTLASGGTANFDLVNAGGVAGTGYDTINVIGSGGLLVTATSGSKFNINLETIAPGTGLPGMATFNSSLSYQWTIFSGTSLSGFSPGDFNLNTSAFTNSLAGGSFSLASGSNNIYLDFTPVPEPSTWVLICGGLAVVGFAVGRRRMASRQA